MSSYLEKMQALIDAQSLQQNRLSKAEDTIKTINFWISAEFPKSLKLLQEENEKVLMNESRRENFETIEKDLKSQFMV